MSLGFVWSWARAAFRLAEVRLRVPIVLVVAAVVVGRWDVIRNYWDRLTRRAPVESVAGRAVSGDTEYFCPMDPGIVSDWTSRRTSLMIFFALGIVALIAFGLAGSITLLAVAYFVVGVAGGGQFGNFITYLSEMFPTSARATGVGWCMGIGLVAWSIVPLVLGLLAPTGNFGTLFAVLGGSACLLGIIGTFLGPETKGQALA